MNSKTITLILFFIFSSCGVKTKPISPTKPLPSLIEKYTQELKNQKKEKDKKQ